MTRRLPTIPPDAPTIPWDQWLKKQPLYDPAELRRYQAERAQAEAKAEAQRAEKKPKSNSKSRKLNHSDGA